MTGYYDIEELKQRTYFQTATLDARFLFKEIETDEDGTRRYMMTGCAHRSADRDGVLCTICGETVK